MGLIIISPQKMSVSVKNINASSRFEVWGLGKWEVLFLQFPPGVAPFQAFCSLFLLSSFGGAI